MRKYQNKDIICPKCEGFVYRKGILGDKPYRCVRCGATFSHTELNEAWFQEHEKRIKEK